jgi:hypothetical protein
MFYRSDLGRTNRGLPSTFDKLLTELRRHNDGEYFGAVHIIISRHVGSGVN